MCELCQNKAILLSFYDSRIVQAGITLTEEDLNYKELYVDFDELLYNAVLVDANGNYKTKNISMKITGDVYKWDSYFSVNPVNGTKPTGYDKPWIECGY